MIETIKRIYYGIIQRIKKIKFSSRKNDICVLMFHDVYAGANDDKKLNISKEHFVEFFDSLLKNDVRFSSVNDLLLSDGNKKCIVTFDDVYEGAILNAVPVLKEYNIPYTLFISPCFIDKKGYITSAQIESLSKDPLCTIGFHTKSHKYMRKLSETEVQQETDCKGFEKQYGIKCEFFAYPYGSVYTVSGKNIKTLKNSNYKAAFGTVCCAINEKLLLKNKFYIPRISISDFSYGKIVKFVKYN